ncbi:MAG TPA: glycosyltransferase family 87 protein [Oculatellaceae cyanobacterium]
MTSPNKQPTEIWRWFKALHVTFLLFIVGAVGQYIFDLYVKHEILRNMHDSRLEYADFLLFYMGGLMASGKDALHFYEPSVQLHYINELLSPYSVAKPIVFHNVPFACLMMLPYVLMPAEPSYLVFITVTVILSIVAVGFWFKYSTGLSWLNRLIVYLHAMASYWSLTNLRMGQHAWNYASLLSLYLFGIYNRLDLVGGIALAWLTLKPHYTAFFALPAICNKRFKLLVIGGVCELVLLAGAAYKIGRENVLNYPQVVLHADASDQVLGIDAYKMVCLRGVLSVFLPQEVALKIGLFSMLGGLILAILIWFATVRAKLRTLNEQRWALSATVILCLTCSPHTHQYDLLLLTPLAFTVFPKLSHSDSPECSDEQEPPSRCYTLWRLMLCAYPMCSWVIIIGGAIVKVSPFTVMFLINVILAVLAVTLWCRQMKRLRARV